MPTRAQNRVRKHWGIGKGALHKRMREAHDSLFKFGRAARWGKVIDADMLEDVLLAVESLAADSIIAADYRDVEKKEYQGPFSAGEGRQV